MILVNSKNLEYNIAFRGGRVKELFEPNSVAIIGASNKPGKVGYVLVKNLIDSGFKGKIFPVNPKEKMILGLRCFPSILDIPETIDMALIAISAIRVPKVVEECGKKGVKLAVIFSAGFAEIGNVELERRIVEIAKDYGLRLLGPNCAGLIINKLNLHACMEARVNKGDLALAAQSGAFGALVISMVKSRGLGLSTFISYGNRADVDEADILQYFHEDEETKAIMMYIEGLRNGRQFIDIASKVTVQKPIIAIKVGKTPASMRAVTSHTGALAGEYRIYEAAFRKCGVYLVDDILELIEVSHILSRTRTILGNRVCIVTNSGGPGVLLTDYIEVKDLEVPQLSYSLRDKLSFLSPMCSTFNPVDLTADANAERYYEVLKVLSQSDECDYIAVIFIPPAYIDPLEVVKGLIDAWRDFGSKKPMAIYIGGEGTKEAINHAEKKGIPIAIDLKSLATSIHALKFRAQYLEKSLRHTN